MTRNILALTACVLLIAASPVAADTGTDVLQTSQGPLKITHIGHASLMLVFNDNVIHVDPCSKVADYAAFPKADLLLITHEHFDHADPAAIRTIRTDATTVVLNDTAAKKVKNGRVLANGEQTSALGLVIEAVPAYNIKNKRPSGEPYHPKGVGNGYIVTFGDKRVYIAGDTENIPEMKELESIHAAFLPINQPYTMTAEMVADTAAALKPKVVYPYHYELGTETDLAELPGLMKGVDGVDLNILKE